MAAAGDVCEQALRMPALSGIPLEVPEGAGVIADKGRDWDPLRDETEAEGLVPLIPHRARRFLPSHERRPPAAA